MNFFREMCCFASNILYFKPRMLSESLYVYLSFHILHTFNLGTLDLFDLRLATT